MDPAFALSGYHLNVQGKSAITYDDDAKAGQSIEDEQSVEELPPQEKPSSPPPTVPRLQLHALC